MSSIAVGCCRCRVCVRVCVGVSVRVHTLRIVLNFIFLECVELKANCWSKRCSRATGRHRQTDRAIERDRQTGREREINTHTDAHTSTPSIHTCKKAQLLSEAVAFARFTD